MSYKTITGTRPLDPAAEITDARCCNVPVLPSVTHEATGCEAIFISWAASDACPPDPHAAA